MRPLHCDRSRQWISIELDGTISSFEGKLLSRHLRRCADCRAFASSVRGQTELLRAAPLELLAAPVEVTVRRQGRPLRKVVMPLVASLAAAAATLTFVAGGSQEPPRTSAAHGQFAGQSSLDALTNFAGGTANLGVQRRLLRRPAVESGVRGVYSLPT